jgi:hypothetical protein
MSHDHRRRRGRTIVATIVMLAIGRHLARGAERRRKRRLLLGSRRGRRRDQRSALALVQGSLQLLRATLRRGPRRARPQQFLRMLFVSLVATAQLLAQPLRLVSRSAY